MSSSTKALLKQAVHHHRPTSRRGMLERMFTMWFRGAVYNQIWEDPRVDAEALQLDSASRVLTISSGGCNVFNYLLHDPERITAIDLNTCHMCLTRLKLTAIRTLPDYDAFFSFFGEGNHDRNIEAYKQHVREHLDEETRRYWEGRIVFGRRMGRRRIDYFASGFYDSAKLGLFLRFVHGVAKVTRRNPQRLLEAKDQTEQQAVFDSDIAPFFDNRFVRWMGNLPVTVFSLGIPPSQYDVMKDESGGKLVELYRERIRKLACDFPLDDNYFTWQAFGRTYDLANRRALPEYLKPENYDRLKANLDRVDTEIVSLHDRLGRDEPGAHNRFVLLDSQDWMPPAVIEGLWTQIARVGGVGARVIFRTAGERSPIEAALPAPLMNRFTYDRELSKRLHDQDRSSIYGMFHIYTLTS